MEKIIRFSLIVLLVVFLHSACTTRTPEKILEQQFNISLKDFDYQVETFDEQWNPNGDGYVYIVFKFNELTENNINYFQSLGLKELPVSEDNEIPDRFLSENGYYLFEKEDSNDERNFKLFVVDTEHNKAILYYQCM
ncbi:MAG: hypothetical protein IKX17_04095 [Prevotella sp.]|nr:hypothetical protein [Prevotella sp.]